MRFANVYVCLYLLIFITLVNNEITFLLINPEIDSVVLPLNPVLWIHTLEEVGLEVVVAVATQAMLLDAIPTGGAQTPHLFAVRMIQ